MLRILFITFVLLLGACSPGSAKSPALAVADPLFTARLLDSAGSMRGMDSWRGQPMLVNFWARWCEPCRIEIPELQAVHSEWRERGVAVLGVALEQNPVDVREFAKQYGMEYPALLAGEKGNALMQALGNRELALPFTVAIDREGHIVGRKIGRISRAEAETLAKAAAGH